ncbi:hypothetical protein HY214_00240 [Candidatus Roizmanbacteria bacterium]|nr:hypothetical protein [Candidatus Roizmanbacteria bacterium]
MTSQSSHPPTGFWFGFALGTMAVGASAFLLGTKKGRQTLAKLLELSENFEENAYSMLAEIEKKAGEALKDSRSVPAAAKQGFQTVLTKIKELSPSTAVKNPKKVFIKEY